jgi:hypothetical protein
LSPSANIGLIATKKILSLSHKYSAAFGGRIKFFRAPISLILQSKINEIGALKKYSRRRKSPKDFSDSLK